MMMMTINNLSIILQLQMYMNIVLFSILLAFFVISSSSLSLSHLCKLSLFDVRFFMKKKKIEKNTVYILGHDIQNRKKRMKRNDDDDNRTSAYISDIFFFFCSQFYFFLFHHYHHWPSFFFTWKMKL